MGSGPMEDPSPVVMMLAADLLSTDITTLGGMLRDRCTQYLSALTDRRYLGVEWDKDGRASKQPAELAINVTQNRPPDLKLEFPGRDVDVSPIEDRRVKLFATASSAYYLEPVGTTRVVVMDVRGTAGVIVIEPTAASDLRAILDTADDAAGTIRWR